MVNLSIGEEDEGSDKRYGDRRAGISVARKFGGKGILPHPQYQRSHRVVIISGYLFCGKGGSSEIT